MSVEAGITGGAALLGGWLANRSRSKEAEKNRRFQERMRNTQWQAAVADMEAAGLNPALAYSQGPNAAPGGSMASQEDIVGPAVSSAMQAKRLKADLQVINNQAAKVKAEGRVAMAAALKAEAMNDLLGVEYVPQIGRVRFKYDENSQNPMERQVLAGIANLENQARLSGAGAAGAETMMPWIENLGAMLPLVLFGGKLGLSRFSRSGSRLAKIGAGRRKLAQAASSRSSSARISGGHMRRPPGMDYKTWLKRIGAHP